MKPKGLERDKHKKEEEKKYSYKKNSDEDSTVISYIDIISSAPNI